MATFALLNGSSFPQLEFYFTKTRRYVKNKQNNTVSLCFHRVLVIRSQVTDLVLYTLVVCVFELGSYFCFLLSLKRNEIQQISLLGTRQISANWYLTERIREHNLGVCSAETIILCCFPVDRNWKSQGIFLKFLYCHESISNYIHWKNYHCKFYTKSLHY